MKQLKNFLTPGLIFFFCFIIMADLLQAENTHKGKIVFLEQNSLCLSDEDGNNKEKLAPTAKEGETYYSPRWSPDGKKIIYTIEFSESSGMRVELWVKDIIKGTTYKLTNGFGPVHWISENEIIFGKIGKDKWTKICKRNFLTAKEDFVAKGKWMYGMADGEIEYVSSKDKLIIQSAGGGRGNIFSAVDFSGKVLLEMPYDIKSSLPCNFEDYNEKDRKLLFSLSTLGDVKSGNLCMINMDTMALTYVYLDNNHKKCISGKWSSDKKSLVVLNAEGNIEVLSEFKTKEGKDGSFIYPLKSVPLTRGGNIFKIRVVNDKIYYLLLEKEKCYLYSIGIDGSSAAKIAETYDFDVFSAR